MIKGKTIYFGYGDVLVGSQQFGNTINLTEIEPPKEIGSTPAKDTYTELQRVVLNVKWEHLSKLKLVKDKTITNFMIEDYILDFSNFNQASIEIVRKHIHNALYYDSLCFAC